MLRKIIGFVLVAALSVGAAPATAAPKVSGTACVKLGATKIASNYKYTCVKSGKKLVWNAGVRVVKSLTLTPTPLVSGTPQAGETLTADSGSWDAGVALSFQWLADGLLVTGEQESSFYLTENEVGKRISVRVTGIKSGFTTVSRVSSPTDFVAGDVETPDVPGLQDIVNSPTPSISGSPTVGSVLTVSVGVWDEGVTLSYRWHRNGVPIQAENDSQHIVSSEDSGTLLSITVTGAKDGFKTVSRTSGSLAIQTVLKDFSVSPAPVLLGTAQVGKTLSAVTGAWSPAPNFSYQWKRNGLAVGRDEPTYMIQDSDLNAAISVVVSGSQQGFRTIARESEATSPVAAAALVIKDFLLSPIPQIVGKAEINQTLTLIAGTWDSGALLQAKWYRNGVEVPGEIGLSYRLSVADVGTRISAGIKGSMDGYQAVTRMSQSSDEVLAMQFLSPSIPIVAGTATTGQTLTVNAGNWDSGSALTYQWYRSGNAVAGATTTSYLLTANDVGFPISVVVTATKDGYATLSRTSTASQVVTQAQLSSTPTPVISGSPFLSNTLTASWSAWDVGVSLAGQWKRNGVIIAGATASTYVLNSADVGSVITFELTGSKLGFPSVTKVSASTPQITAQTFSQSPLPTITGTSTSAQTLTINAGVWDSGAILAYQWLRNGIGIQGAIGQTYLLTQADVGSVIQVSVTATKAGFETSIRLSLPTSPIAQAVLSSTPAPAITGTPILGSTLSAAWASWDNGVSTQGQWKRNGINIPGATSSSYVLTSSDVGFVLTFELTGAKSGYPSVTKISPPTATVSALTFSQSPTPTISGTPTTGQVLSLIAGIWDSGTVLKYQWNRGGTPILGATAVNYSLSSADVGMPISVTVTATKTGHEPLSRVSNATSPVVQAVFASTPEPIISGSPLLASKLTATWAAWDAGVATTYRWKRNGVSIPGAIFATYTTVTADIGAILTFEITGSKTGYTTVVKSSQPTAVITALTFALAPTPTISGTPMVLKTLSVSVGVWDLGTSFSYQWLRNGSAIAGATGLSYQLTVADQGAAISFRVTASKANAEPLILVSSPTSPILATQITMQGTPAISGTAAVGNTLTAAPGVWDFGVTFTYQWRRGLYNIAGATFSSFTVTAGELNSTLSVVVTGTLGTAVVSKTSANTPAVTLGVLKYSSAPGFYGEYVVGGQIYRTDGVWPAGTKLSYQWLSNGSPIVGAINYIYYPAVATLGTSISLRLTASLAGYQTAVVDTAGSPLIGPGSIGSLTVPAIVGTPKSGETLSLDKAGYCSTNLSTPVTISYQWTRNGVAISGQTATSYVVVDADSGAQVGLTARCTSTGYAPRLANSTPVSVLVVPTLPFITSIDESQVTKLKITWTGTLGNSYVFDLVNPSTNGGRKTCDSNSCLWENLAGGTRYTINYSATASGGSKMASFTATTYARLNLTAAIKSFTMQGDRWTLDFVPVPTWTYKFSWETYGLGTSQCTNGFVPETTQSPISVRAWIRTGCAKILRISDGHGNLGELVLNNYTQLAVPAAEISVSLGSTSANSGSTVGYSYQFNHYYSLTSTTFKLFDAAGAVVVLPIAPTNSRSWGDAYQGGYNGLLYLTGVAAGAYTAKITFVDRAGVSTTITVGSLTVT